MLRTTHTHPVPVVCVAKPVAGEPHESEPNPQAVLGQGRCKHLNIAREKLRLLGLAVVVFAAAVVVVIVDQTPKLSKVVVQKGNLVLQHVNVVDVVAMGIRCFCFCCFGGGGC